MIRKAIPLFAITLLLLFPLLLRSQSTAVVLSGGGAKGFAHIGVLQALEENDIPIDYIVGNSMGALVGGLYASGYTPEQIKKLLTNPELYNFQRGNTKKEIFFFQKFQDDASMINIPFEVDKGIKAKIPFNVYNIQDLDYMLMQVFAGASAASDYKFDSLFIPFRAVATDIDSSKLLILRKGDLATAVRASMTFPFFIKPIKRDGKLLFDGGMLDNFPVDATIKEFSPDFIIGSKAVNNFAAPKADDVFSQMQSMLMRKADFTLDSTDGFLIEILSGDENVFQFDRVERYIDSGYRAAMRSIPQIKTKLEVLAQPAQVKEKRADFNEKKLPLIVGEIKVEGVNKKQEQYFLKSFTSIDERLTSNEFKKQYNRLLANENVKSVYPSLSFNRLTGKYDITFDIKTVEPIYLGFGGYISSSAVNEGFVELGYNNLGRTSKHLYLNTYFGTFYNSLFASAKFEVQGKVPVSVMLDFLLSRKNYFTSATYFFEDQAPAYIVMDENYLDLNFGIPVGLSHALRIGVSNLNVNYLYYQDNYFTRTDTADRSNFYFVNPYIEFERNSLNRKQFASKGSRFYAGFNYYFGNEHTIPGSTALGAMEYRRDLQFYVASVHYEQYFNIFKPFVLGITGDLVWSNKPLLNNYVSSLLIASQYEPIPMMQTLFLENYRAYSYGGIGAKAIFDIYKQFEIRLQGYYYAPYRKILSDDGVSFSQDLSYQYVVGNVQLVYHTAVGPIGFGVNYFEKDGDKFSFLFNIGYLFFNKSRFSR